MSTVAAVITTYNRAGALEESLTRLSQQSRRPDEVWIIDDASTDDTRQVVRKTWPSAFYLKLPVNSGGCIYGRNLALCNVSTDYILWLDDDSWFEDLDGLSSALSYADANLEASVIALNVRHSNGHLLFKLEAPGIVGQFMGCGALFRVKRMIRVELLFESLFERQGEEKDFALRLIAADQSIHSLPSTVVFHAVREEARNWSRIRLLEQRNDILRELLRCPAPLLFFRLVRCWLSHTRYNLLNGYWRTDITLLLLLPFLISKRASRCPVAISAYTTWISLTNQ